MNQTLLKKKAFSLAEKVGNSLANWSDKGFAEGDKAQTFVYANLKMQQYSL